MKKVEFIALITAIVVYLLGCTSIFAQEESAAGLRYTLHKIKVKGLSKYGYAGYWGWVVTGEKTSVLYVIDTSDDQCGTTYKLYSIGISDRGKSSNPELLLSVNGEIGLVSPVWLGDKGLLFVAYIPSTSVEGGG